MKKFLPGATPLIASGLIAGAVLIMGVLEPQEARWVSITPLDWMPRVTWLGLFPTAESVAAQLVFVIPLMAAVFLWPRKRRVYAAMEAENA
ncbi:MAG TPA: hypothetical protein HPP50_07210, partial [Rhodospirillaceae bacterium]|nr:hypothetical protein [Rhodospirillaceae bacterium]